MCEPLDAAAELLGLVGMTTISDELVQPLTARSITVLSRHRRFEERIDAVAADRASTNFVRFCRARRVVVARVVPGSAAVASPAITDEEVSGVPPDGDGGWSAGTPDPA